MSGIFVQGHVKLDAMLEVIRVVKPGTYLYYTLIKHNSHMHGALNQMDRPNLYNSGNHDLSMTYLIDLHVWEIINTVCFITVTL